MIDDKLTYPEIFQIILFEAKLEEQRVIDRRAEFISNLAMKFNITEKEVEDIIDKAGFII